MANVVVLDNVSHRHLQVSMNARLQAYDGLGAIQVFPNELDAAHKEFPIFLRKHSESGQFFLSALLSPAANKNNYSAHDHWTSRYTPLMARRGPFLLSKSSSSDVVHLCVDFDDERVKNGSERLFDDDGKTLAITERITRILQMIHYGHQQTEQLVQALSKHQLIEALVINSGLALQQSEMLNGLYSVNAEKLMLLPEAALFELNKNGHLQQAYFIASSASNVMTLLDKNNL